MKVNNHHPHELNGAAMRPAAQARSGAAATGATVSAAPATAPASAPATPAVTPTGMAAPAPVESTVDMAARKVPPGLARVAARLEAMGAEGRTAGQTNAMAQITRNLQRYTETQGVTPPPAPLPDSQVVLPEAPTPSTDTAPPVTTPLDGDGKATQ